MAQRYPSRSGLATGGESANRAERPADTGDTQGNTMTDRMTRRLLPCAFALAAALPAAAQEQSEIGPDDWQVRCEEGGCLVVKPVPLDDAGRRLLLTFAVPQEGGNIRMALITPLGTDLEQGMRLQVGARDVVYRFSTCMTDGCVIIAELTPDDVANMGVQPQMTATFAAVNRPEPYAVDIPLADFEEAIAVARNGGQQ
jgi:invasion protein IalB